MIAHAQRKPIDATFGGTVVPIRTHYQVVTWGDAWQAHAERMELLYDYACIARDLSEALRADCEREVERLRGLLG